MKKSFQTGFHHLRDTNSALDLFRGQRAADRAGARLRYVVGALATACCSKPGAVRINDARKTDCLETKEHTCVNHCGLVH